MMHVTMLTRRGFYGSMAATILWASLTVPSSAQRFSNGDNTEARIASAMAGLQRFRSSRSLDDLRATSRGLRQAVDFRVIEPRDMVARRRSIVTAYAQLFHEIEAASDTAFDPNDLPALCITPPREPDGRQLPSCADPNDISDPATRAQYVAAVDANTAKIQHRNAQIALRLLDDESMFGLHAALRAFRSRAPSDTAALDEILRRAGLSEARRVKIHAIL